MKTKICSISEVRSNQFVVSYLCDNCGSESTDRKSHFDKKNRHFCSSECYSIFRRTKLPFNEQHAYKGVRQEGESKQIYHRRYCESHPENIAHLKARRYAREKGAEGSHSLDEWNKLKEGCDHLCLHCGEEKKLTKDHIIPLSEGGSDYIENIQPLCRNCNSKKWKFVHENPELLEK